MLISPIIHPDAEVLCKALSNPSPASRADAINCLTALGYSEFTKSKGAEEAARKAVERCRETFETAIELEEDEEGCFDVQGLREAMKNAEVELAEQEFECLVYRFYQQTGDVHRLKRTAEGLVVKNDASLSSIKEDNDESYFDKVSPKKEDKAMSSRRSEEKQPKNGLGEKQPVVPEKRKSSEERYTGFDEEEEK
mmetsp:Transcript_17688/g.20443  ORF Transcript_17688/g.20443 Transcript_17688/m.20443 type:complete len:195 (-) Transcript_17688:1395-1979(-)